MVQIRNKVARRCQAYAAPPGAIGTGGFMAATARPRSLGGGRCEVRSAPPAPCWRKRKSCSPQNRLTSISHLRYSRPILILLGVRRYGQRSQGQESGRLGQTGREGAEGQGPGQPDLGHAGRLRRQAALYGRRSRRLRGRPVRAGCRALHARRARHHVCRPALDHPPICRLLHGRRIQRLLPQEPRGRADGPVGRLRSGHPSRL